MKFNYRNASKQELKEQFKKIAAITQDGVYKPTFFGLPIIMLGSGLFEKRPLKKQLFSLPSLLGGEEDVLALCSGLFDGSSEVMVLTTERIIIMENTFLLEKKMIPLKSIQSIEINRGLLSKLRGGVGNVKIKADKTYRFIGAATKTIELFIDCVNRQLAVIKQAESEQIT